MVFDKFEGYGFIHHRALNEYAALQKYLKLVAEFPQRTHILEGDICWDFSEGNELFYFRHPSYVIDTLPTKVIADGLQSNKLIGLDHLSAVRPTNALLVIELKVGKGTPGRFDWKVPLSRLVERLEDEFTGRYWIDGFSLPMLQFIKSISPATTVSLHTEFVYKGRVLIGAPEFPPIRFRRLDDLPEIDGIAIRRRGSESFMSRACADVRSAGKVLMLSRLHTLRQFECSKLWGAAAGYMHWDFKELLDFNDSIDRGVTPLTPGG